MCQRKAQKIGPINALDNCHKRNWSLTNSQSLRCHFRFCAATRNSFHWIFFFFHSLLLQLIVFNLRASNGHTHYYPSVSCCNWKKSMGKQHQPKQKKKNAPIEIEKCRKKNPSISLAQINFRVEKNENNWRIRAKWCTWHSENRKWASANEWTESWDLPHLNQSVIYIHWGTIEFQIGTRNAQSIETSEYFFFFPLDWMSELVRVFLSSRIFSVDSTKDQKKKIKKAKEKLFRTRERWK